VNVLLLHLPLARRSYLSRFSLPEPLAQLCLAPVLQGSDGLGDRHDVRVVDLRVTPALDRELGGWRPGVALVGVNPLTIASADRVLADLRARFAGIRVLLFADAEYGNSHVHERPLDFAHPLADAIAQVFSLARLRAIVPAAVAAWEERRPLALVPGLLVQASPGAWIPTQPVENRIGEIGVPDRSRLGRARGRYRFGGIGRMAHLFYTFGCRHKCRFCPMSRHDGSIIARSLDHVIAELEALTEPHVFLQDYEPFLAPAAMEDLACAVERAGIRKSWYMMTRADTALEEEALIRRWKKLGLRWLYLGLDGATPERLREVQKGSTVERNEAGLRRMLDLDLCVSVGFVVRPDFTREEFAALRGYVRRLGAPLVSFTVETPLVGTRLFDESEGRLTTRDWSLYDLEHAVLPTAMPLAEFYRQMARLHLEAGMRTVPAMLRHFPMRDALRAWASGPGALLDVRRAARDHERPAAGSRPPAIEAAAAAGA